MGQRDYATLLSKPAALFYRCLLDYFRATAMQSRARHSLLIEIQQLDFELRYYAR